MQVDDILTFAEIVVAKNDEGKQSDNLSQGEFYIIAQPVILIYGGSELEVKKGDLVITEDNVDIYELIRAYFGLI